MRCGQTVVQNALRNNQTKVQTMNSKTQFVSVDGEQDGINFDAPFKVQGYRGIAWRLLGWAVALEPVTCLAQDDDGNEYEEETGEYDDVADMSRVVAIMVGDDRRFVIDRRDLIPITEDAFCHSCGQIGCSHSQPIAQVVGCRWRRTLLAGNDAGGLKVQNNDYTYTWTLGRVSNQ